MRLDDRDLNAIAERVAEVLEQRQYVSGKVGTQIAYTEAQAAELLGIPRTSLRDARQRGEVPAEKVGKRYLYYRETLIELVRPKEN